MNWYCSCFLGIEEHGDSKNDSDDSGSLWSNLDYPDSDSSQEEECEISQEEELEWTKNEVSNEFYEEEAGNVNLSTHQEHDCNLQESVATSQDEEQGGATNEVCVQNTASTGHMGQDCFIKEIVATNQEEEQGGATNEDIVNMGQDCTIKEIVATIEEEEQGGTTKNQVSSFIDEEFALKMATTQEEEHVRTTNTVLLQNTGSTHEEQINANTIDKIFLEVCASQAVAVEHKVPSSLPPPSDDELPLSSLLPPGFKMKKGVKSEKIVTKNRRITRSRKN